MASRTTSLASWALRVLPPLPIEAVGARKGTSWPRRGICRCNTCLTRVVLTLIGYAPGSDRDPKPNVAELRRVWVAGVARQGAQLGAAGGAAAATCCAAVPRRAPAGDVTWEAPGSRWRAPCAHQRPWPAAPLPRQAARAQCTNACILWVGVSATVAATLQSTKSLIELIHVSPCWQITSNSQLQCCVWMVWSTRVLHALFDGDPDAYPN